MKTNKFKLSIAISGILAIASVLIAITLQSCTGKTVDFQVNLKPIQGVLMTEIIQKAIDKCSANGGGSVAFSEGTYLTGSIRMKSDVALFLEKGSTIRGSDKYADYDTDAVIDGVDLKNISIIGEGIIDGVDCYNPNGEEGFRGPHGIRLKNCQDIIIRDITIKNSANWAINCRKCSNAKIERVNIRAGHDGLHTRFCNNFNVSGCDFRTGDDAFAGNDNRDFLITDCKVNTSCNGFRLGCLNLKVQRCKLWGPGENIHKVQKRNNMLSAFVHFSPKDENPGLQSGNWLIQDLTVENVDHFYMYNYNNGLWQTGQPVSSVRFERVQASGLLSAFNVTGDTARNFNLFIHNSSFSFREGSFYADSSFFEGVVVPTAAMVDIRSFNQLEILNSTFEKDGQSLMFKCDEGNSLVLENSQFIGKVGKGLQDITGVKLVKNSNTPKTN